MGAILKTPTRSVNPILQNRYPNMVKCLNIVKNAVKPIYRPISTMHYEFQHGTFENAWSVCLHIFENRVKKCHALRLLYHIIYMHACKTQKRSCGTSLTTHVEVPEHKNTFDLSIREKPFKRKLCPAIKGDYIWIHTSRSSASYLYQPSALWLTLLSVQIGLV